MPELPEVETMVRGIRPSVQHRRLISLRKCRCSRRPLRIRPALPQIRKRIVGRILQDVRRVGKRVLLCFAGDEILVIEPRMSGLLLLADPPTREHLRLQWEFDGKDGPRRLWYWDRRGLGRVTLYRAEEWQRTLEEIRLGPDALAMTVPEWRNRCRKTHRPIKVALLDQRFVAGIGNLYASEILHESGIHPATPADQLSPAQIRRLSSAVRKVLREAIRYEGSTLGDQTYRNVLNQRGRYQNRHRVYGRAGELCPRCQTARIQRIVQQQRSTFFCPLCQQRAV